MVLEGEMSHVEFALALDRKSKDRLRAEKLGGKKFRLTLFLTGETTLIEIPLISEDGKLQRWKIEVSLPSYEADEYKRAHPRKFHIHGGPYLGYQGGFSTEVIDGIATQSGQAILPVIGGEAAGTFVRDIERFHFAPGIFGELGFQFLNMGYRGNPAYAHTGLKFHFRNIWNTGWKTDFRLHAILTTLFLFSSLTGTADARPDDATVLNSFKVRWVAMPWLDIGPVAGLVLGRFSLEFMPRVSYSPAGYCALSDDSKSGRLWGWAVGGSVWSKLPVWKLFAQLDVNYAIMRGMTSVANEAVGLDISAFTYFGAVGIWF